MAFRLESPRTLCEIYESHESYTYFLWLRFAVQHRSRITPCVAAVRVKTRDVIGCRDKFSCEMQKHVYLFRAQVSLILQRLHRALTSRRDISYLFVSTSFAQVPEGIEPEHVIPADSFSTRRLTMRIYLESSTETRTSRPRDLSLC
jgi:hypothetical protein